jgi:NADPH2:quinone reductase
MLAVLFDDFGVDNIRLGDVPDPTPARGEVLIRVEAATINPADAALVSGALSQLIPAGVIAPYTPGWDCAGRVVSLGEGVDAQLLGARVVGFSLWFATGYGTQASLVTLPVANIAIAPDGLPSAQLTTLGLNGLTAWRAIDEVNPLRGETLVVTGAAGSVGGFAVELAVARGASVIAAVYEKDRDIAVALGASSVVTVEQGDLGDAVRAVAPAGADALLDTASLAEASLGAIRDSGRYVTVTNPPEPTRHIAVARVGVRPDAAALATLIAMATNGHLQTPVAATYPAAEARAAYAEFGAGSRRGRLVLTF